MIKIEDLKFRMQSHLAMEKEHIMTRVCEEYKCTWQIVTPKKAGHGGFGEAKQYFYIDGVDEEFLTPEALVEALNKRKLRIV